MEIKTTYLEDLDGLELKEAVFQRHKFPEHFHDSYSIGFIEQGVERLSFGNHSILAPAHKVVVIHPYEIHANSYFDLDCWKYRCFYINPDIMRYYQRQNGFPGAGLVHFPEQLIDDFRLYNLLLQVHLSKTSSRLSMMEMALNYLLRNYGKTVSKPEHHISPIMRDAAEYLTKNSTSTFQLEKVATRFGMGKFSFIRAFKNQTGLTPNAYLVLQRINLSKKLIAEDCPIIEVALETGFYDQSHFTNCFKKHIGISPLAYRKGLENRG